MSVNQIETLVFVVLLLIGIPLLAFSLWAHGKWLAGLTDDPDQQRTRARRTPTDKSE